jgi:hypothetical protein
MTDYPPPCRIIDVQNPSSGSELTPFYRPAIDPDADAESAMSVVTIMLAAIGVWAIVFATAIGLALVF